MDNVNSHGFQIVTTLPEPLGLFFRPGRADHTTVDQALSEGRVMSGAVLEPTHIEFQSDLISNLGDRSLRAVLDPLGLELSTPAGLTPARRKLEWADATPHQAAGFNAKKVDRSARLIAAFTKAHNFGAVLAPTHFLASGAADPWFMIDRRLTAQLKRELDAVGAKDVPIYYPLAVPSGIFFDPVQRKALIAALGTLEIDAIWLRVSPFGANNGAPSLQNYIIACRDFHSLKLPLVAEKTGAHGLSLLAFGAVSGLESGVSVGEQFNYARLQMKPKPGRKAFAPRPRVYLQSLGLFVSRDDAERLFHDSKMRPYACSDTDCCHKGFKSTLADPRRHFANSRIDEVNKLSAMPASLRPSGYLQQMLRPADEYLQRLVPHLESSFKSLAKPLVTKSRRLHGCRKTLTAMQTSHPIESVCHNLKASA